MRNAMSARRSAHAYIADEGVSRNSLSPYASVTEEWASGKDFGDTIMPFDEARSKIVARMRSFEAGFFEGMSSMSRSWVRSAWDVVSRRVWQMEC